MATTKTLTPTNETITIDAFQGEKPDYRHVADAETKLADAVNALNSQLSDYSNSNATKVGDNWTNGVIRAHRRGYVVTLKIDGASLSAASTRVQIATVSEGYRPVTEVGFASDDGSRRFICSSNGTLYMDPQNAGTVWGSVTYVCNR